MEPDLDVYPLAFLYGKSGPAIETRHTRLVPERQSFSARTFGIVLEVKLPSPKIENREKWTAAADGDRQGIVLLKGVRQDLVGDRGIVRIVTGVANGAVDKIFGFRRNRHRRKW